jgi:thioredoxin-like negative regulator of GroEL
MPSPNAVCPVAEGGRSSLTTSWPVSSSWHDGARGYQLGLGEQERSKAPMVVYFFTDWCPYCREFERELLYHWELERYLRSRAIKVRINPEKGAEEQAVARAFGLSGYPSFFLATGAAPARRLSHRQSGGNLKSPREFIETVEDAVARVARQMIHDGWDLRSRGDLVGSLAAFEQALAISPEDPEAYYQRALSFLEEGDLDRAFEDFNAALRLQPDQVDAYEHAGQALADHRRWDESVACWTRAVDAKPQDTRARIGRARAHDGRGDRARALEDLAEACRLGDLRGCAIAEQLGGRL